MKSSCSISYKLIKSWKKSKNNTLEITTSVASQQMFDRYFRAPTPPPCFSHCFLDPIIRIFMNTLTLCIKQQSARNEEFQGCSTLAQNGNRRASSWYIQTKVRHSAKFPDYLAGEGGRGRNGEQSFIGRQN